MRAPFSMLKPNGPPPFDLTTLNTSFRVKAGDFIAYPAPAGSALGSGIWVGTPSAGVSGNFDAFRDNVSNLYAGPTLDGKQTVDFGLLSNSQGRRLNVAAADANARLGVAGAVETAVANGIASGIYTAAAGTMWALAYLISITPGTGESGLVQGPGNGSGGPSLMTSGSGPWPAGFAGRFIDGGHNGNSFIPMVAPATGVWTRLYFRWGLAAGQWDVWVGKAAKTTTVGNVGMTTGGTLALGANGYASADVYLADVGIAPVAFDDATMLNIDDGLLALYPSVPP